jgi:hypothetical protein
MGDLRGHEQGFAERLAGPSGTGDIGVDQQKPAAQRVIATARHRHCAVYPGFVRNRTVLVVD